MRCRDASLQLAALHDRERTLDDALASHLATCADCRAELAALEHLSALLAVEQPQPDAGFLARFRMRRDRLREAAGIGAPWRWLAVRLVPLSVAAAAAAGFTLWLGGPSHGDLHELEAQALGSGLAAVTEETLIAERVLGLVLEPPAPASESEE